MVDDQGNITTDTTHMAELLHNHWSRTFRNTDTNHQHLTHWLKTAYEEGPPRKASPQDWTPRKKDLRRAFSISNASAPGPDGIPYAAWKQGGRRNQHPLGGSQNHQHRKQRNTTLPRIQPGHPRLSSPKTHRHHDRRHSGIPQQQHPTPGHLEYG